MRRPWNVTLSKIADRSGYVKGNGYVIYDACQLLKIEARAVVEIGVYKGKTSMQLRRLFGPDVKLYLVDPWLTRPEIDYRLYQESLEQDEWEGMHRHVSRQFINDPMTKILRCSSESAAQIVPDGVDAIFIDGDHRYEAVRQDIDLWLPKMSKPGIICGHDFHRYYPGVKQAVQETWGRNYALGPRKIWMHYERP